jgi:hypothetical protein
MTGTIESVLKRVVYQKASTDIVSYLSIMPSFNVRIAITFMSNNRRTSALLCLRFGWVSAADAPCIDVKAPVKKWRSKTNARSSEMFHHSQEYLLTIWKIFSKPIFRSRPLSFSSGSDKHKSKPTKCSSLSHRFE